MENLAKLKTLIAAAEADADKFFYKGNASAGTRLRKTMQEIKSAAQLIRNDVTLKKNK